MQTLYEQYKPAWDRIATTRPSLARMAMHVATKQEMERGLGYGSSVVIKWLSGQNTPARESDFRAEKWLSERASPAPVKQATPSPSAALLLVACPSPDVAAKVQRVLAVLGCEVTEV